MLLPAALVLILLSLIAILVKVWTPSVQVGQPIDWRFGEYGPIDGKSVSVRPLTQADLGDYVDSIDELVEYNNGWRRGSLRSIRRYRDHPKEAAGLLTGNNAVIEFAETQRTIGEVTAMTMRRAHDSDVHTVEVGIHIRADHRGRGLAKRALSVGVGRLFLLGWSRVVIGCSDTNPQMMAVASCIGAVEYHRGPHKMANGEIANAIWFELRPATLVEVAAFD